MGLFEDVVVNAKSAVDVVGKKAGKFVDVSKLRINAADINNEISRKFEELGRAVYEAAKDGSDTSNAVSEHSAEINDLYDQLNAVNGTACFRTRKAYMQKLRKRKRAGSDILQQMRRKAYGVMQAAN